MPIKGLTDEGARKKRQQSYWSGILHKGTRKIKRQDGKEVFGKDLERFFRFEPKSDLARDILMRAYPEAKCDQNGDIILQELDIFAATSEIWISCNAPCMIRWKRQASSRPIAAYAW